MKFYLHQSPPTKSSIKASRDDARDGLKQVRSKIRCGAIIGIVVNLILAGTLLSLWGFAVAGEPLLSGMLNYNVSIFLALVALLSHAKMISIYGTFLPIRTHVSDRYGLISLVSATIAFISAGIVTGSVVGTEYITILSFLISIVALLISASYLYLIETIHGYFYDNHNSYKDYFDDLTNLYPCNESQIAQLNFSRRYDQQVDRYLQQVEGLKRSPVEGEYKILRESMPKVFNIEDVKSKVLDRLNELTPIVCENDSEATRDLKNLVLNFGTEIKIDFMPHSELQHSPAIFKINKGFRKIVAD